MRKVLVGGKRSVGHREGRREKDGRDVLERSEKRNGRGDVPVLMRII